MKSLGNLELAYTDPNNDVFWPGAGDVACHDGTGTDLSATFDDDLKKVNWVGGSWGIGMVRYVIGGGVPHL